jgi:von Willebrand factor type A domain
MPRPRRAAALAALLLLASPLLSAQRRGPGPLRIVMLVDSSSTVSQMIPQFRAGMNAFLDVLPGDPEIAIISTGGQIRIRVPPTTDRERLHKAASSFASDGGANSFLDTMLEADRRFLKPSDRRPVFVIMMTDGSEIRGEARVDEYNRWVHDFLRRGGRAHGIVVRGVVSGITTDILVNLTSNTGGFYDSLNVANPLAERMKALAALVAADMP